MSTETLIIDTVFMTNDYQNPVSALKRGDMGAFRFIFEQNCRLVGGFIYGMVGDAEIAEELAQETFVRAFQSINSLKDETKLSTWLCGIAKNIVYNFYRSRQTQKAKLNEQNYLLDSLPINAPDKELLNNELNIVINRSLQKLDDDRRIVFTLKILQQLSYVEISEITGHSISKLKTDLHRAKADMRKMVGKYLGENHEM